jgi:hypothetical protein
MNRKTISFVPNAVSYKNKKEGKMNRKSFISLLGLVFLMSLILTISAYGEDKLIVKDAQGQKSVFKVTDTGMTYCGITTPMPIGASLVVGLGAGFQRFSDWYGDGANIEYGRARGTESSPTPVQNGDETGRFLFTGYDGTNRISSARFGGITDGTVSAGVVPQAIYFKTGSNTTPTERMRITSLGRVGIGTTAPAYLLDVNGQARINGIVYGSSRSLKDNIADLKSSEALEALKGLNPVKFTYKAEGSEKHIGFIAEDVPDLVAKNGRTGIDPMDVIAVLTKVVQQQQKTITKLAEKVADLEKEVKLKGSVALIQY